VIVDHHRLGLRLRTDEARSPAVLQYFGFPSPIELQPRSEEREERSESRDSGGPHSLLAAGISLALYSASFVQQVNSSVRDAKVPNRMCLEL
jgi:hypothetical protein